MSKRVLLFEDHEIVRHYLVEVLTAAGYEVSAHEHVHCSPEDIVAAGWNCVILDSGALAALRELRRVGYLGGVLVATGADLSQRDKQDVAALGGRVLFKPFLLADLLSALNAAGPAEEPGDVSPSEKQDTADGDSSSSPSFKPVRQEGGGSS